MPEIKQVKIVSDGQEYWLLWHWEKVWLPNMHPAHEQLSGRYSYVSGPFGSAAEAEQAIPDGWERTKA